MKYLLTIPEEFDNQITSVAYRAGVSKIKAIMMGIELLERLVDSEKVGKTFIIADKKKPYPDFPQDLG
jgi:hypothetical protein